MDNHEVKAFIFDLDGTLYLGNKAIPGAVETLNWVRKNKAQVRFLTNNPRYSQTFYLNKLNQLGITCDLEEILSSAQLTANYLATHLLYKNIFVIGEDQLKQELLDKNISLVEHSNADAVLVSFDASLTYDKLMTAYHALRKGAKLVATHPDYVCPTPDGGLIDAGATVAALEVATGKKVEKIFGKPSKYIGELLIQQLKVDKRECVIVGDRLNTDIRLGQLSGMKTVWIRAFNEPLPDDKAYFPDFIIQSIAELPSVMCDLNLVGIND